MIMVVGREQKAKELLFWLRGGLWIRTKIVSRETIKQRNLSHGYGKCR